MKISGAVVLGMDALLNGAALVGVAVCCVLVVVFAVIGFAYSAVNVALGCGPRPDEEPWA